MSDKYLNSHKLATLSEFRYILLEVLDRRDPISWHDLSFSCKEFSLNFAFSFENSVTFLELISLLNIHIDRSVSRNNENYEAVRSDEDLTIFLLRKTIIYLEHKTLLEKIFNEKTVALDRISDLVLLQLTELPVEFSFIRPLLLNLNIVVPGVHEKGMLRVAETYKPFFRKELLPKVFKNMPPEGSISKPPMLFISYAYKDKDFKNELQKHFSGLKMLNLIRDWEGRAILPGEDWEDEIRQKLEQAEVVLFLVSADFMASEYINDVEIKKTIERHAQGKVRIIPIIVRPCDFDSLPIKRYQALPERARAISLWENKDEAYLNIVNRIKEVIKQLSTQTNYSS